MKKILITILSVFLVVNMNPQYAMGQNNTISYLDKGVLYYNMADYTKAVEMFRLAADMGSDKAQFKLGLCYYNGKGVSQDFVKAVEWYTKAANQGFVEAQLKLGICYLYGEGVRKDESKAEELISKAANQGYANAQALLGYCYLNGKGVQQDESKAVKWYTKAANQGYAPAQNALGECYYEGDGVPEDYIKAVEWFTKAANQDNAEALYNLGNCYSKGRGVAENTSKAIELYIKSANLGCADASFQLGECYEKGFDLPKDENKAVEWYTKAAEQGHKEVHSKLAEYNKKYSWLLLQTRSLTQKGDSLYVLEKFAEAFNLYKRAAYRGDDVAQLCLARSYMQGRGVAQNEFTAVKWIRNSANQENAVAQFLLGYCYENGIGDFLKFNKKEAYRWYLKAAMQNYEDAVFRGACFFYEGLEHEEEDMDGYALGYYSWDNIPSTKVVDVQQDYKKAAVCFEAIAEQGHLGGQYGLGLCYFYGQGVEKDETKAASLFEKAACQGLAEAQFNLAFCYYNGVGVAKNVQLARGWLNQSAAQGNLVAKKALNDNVIDKLQGLPVEVLDSRGIINAIMKPSKTTGQSNSSSESSNVNPSSSVNDPSVRSTNHASVSVGTLDNEHAATSNKSMLQVEANKSTDPSRYETSIKVPQVTINTVPEYAYLYIDGKERGKTPCSIEVEPGVHDILITKDRYRKYKKRLRIGSTNSQITIRLKRQYQDPYNLYLHAGYQYGSMTAAVAALGFYWGNFNYEGFFLYGLDESEKIHWSGSDYHYESVYKAIGYGGKFGYGIIAGTRCRFTPQIGVMALTMKSEPDNYPCHAILGTAGIRFDLSLSTCWDLFVAPEMPYAFFKSDCFKQLEQVSPTIKDWGEKWNVRMGISFNLR